ncbi:MAG: ABC transporter substrate-binding protein [Chloroflexota bacterium]|nr:ABC transporter substrate-binding protein [Chloroflexota bacterium]
MHVLSRFIPKVLPLVLVAALVLAVACGPSATPTPTTAPTATPTATPRPTPTATPTATPIPPTPTPAPTPTPTATLRPGETPRPTPTPTPTPVPTATTTPTPRPVATPTPTATATPTLPKARRGGRFVYGPTGPGFPERWDMTLSSHYSATQQLARHYSGLLQFSARDGTTVVPDLAEKYEVGGNMTEFTLKLYPGIKWHDGEPLTVDDVIYALNRWISPPKGVVQPRVAGFKGISAIQKIDERTLKITIKSPSVDFLYELADPWHVILPKKYLEMEGGVDRAERIIGTGPFKLKASERDSFITSVAYPGYHRTGPDGKPYPYLDEVTSIAFGDWESAEAAFRTGRIDLVNEIDLEKAVAIQKDLGDKIILELWNNPGIYHLTLNNLKPPFDDFRCRKALFLAIDKVGITEALQLKGVPQMYKPASFFGSTDPFWDDVPKLKGYNPATRTQDVAEARELAKACGLTAREFTIITHTGAWSTESMQLAQQHLQVIGVTAKIKVVDVPSIWTTGAEKNFEALYFGTGVVNLNPMDVILADYARGAGRNYAWVPPENWEKLVEKAKTTLPGPERNEIFRELDRIMREEWIPVIPLARVTGSPIVRWKYVRDFDAIPGAKFTAYKLEDIWLDDTAPRR